MPSRILRFLGIPVEDVTTAETLALVARWINEYRAGGPPHQIVTVNPEFVIDAQRNRAFRRVLLRADLHVPDGVGLLVMAPLLGHRLRERVTGSDLLPLLAEQAARLGHRLFLLGAAPGVAEQTADLLVQTYPGLHIAGTFAGSPALIEEDEIISRVRASNADILAVAYGAPQQDIWIARNLARTGAATGIGVGGAFDHLTGRRLRAPVILRRVGLEWVFRLITQPWRWRRMLKLPVFVLLVALEALGRLVAVAQNRKKK